MAYLLLKKTILTVVSPLTVVIILLVIGTLLLWFYPKRRSGKILVTIGAIYLCLTSFSFLPDLCLIRLERKYPSNYGVLYYENLKKIQYIVVLAGGHVGDPEIPITSQFTYEGLVRLIEGIRWFKSSGPKKIILSGGVGVDPISNAELMLKLSMELGVKREKIILEKESKNTYEEALFIKSIVNEEDFLLVTSASHMPRSVGLFEKFGMSPVPLPTGHLVKKYGRNVSLLPDALNLYKMDIFFYEILGIVKARILGRV